MKLRIIEIKIQKKRLLTNYIKKKISIAIFEIIENIFFLKILILLYKTFYEKTLIKYKYLFI